MNKIVKSCFFVFVLTVLMTQIAGAQSLQSDRQMLINYAKKFLGTPYKASGSTVHGMDCSGFLFTVVRDSLKIPFPRTAEAMYKNCEIIKEGLLEPGDLVFFRPGSKINHVGIYIGEGNFIHSASDGPKTGVIISNLSDSYWNRTYAGAGRILPSIINGQ